MVRMAAEFDMYFNPANVQLQPRRVTRPARGVGCKLMFGGPFLGILAFSGGDLHGRIEVHLSGRPLGYDRSLLGPRGPSAIRSHALQMKLNRTFDPPES